MGRSRGFTLIELMVVIAIIGVLLALLLLAARSSARPTIEVAAVGAGPEDQSW